ncbi:MAG: glycosyltransferase family 2 protein, partial [Acidobacteriaceae bacterium]|nr:glycosyltransferase family 2 protein [Acidobacteriaceae bacterium]
DRKVRLFDRRKARWVGEFVHETVKVEGPVGHLKSNLLHFTCNSLSEHLRTMDSYTTLAAQEIVSRGKTVSFGDLLFDPPWTFLRTYVLKFGFLDGVEGLAIAYMAALYNFVKYSKAHHMSPGRKS